MRARPIPIALSIAAALALGCVEPEDRRPGLWLSGEAPTAAPKDWSFTDAHREIAIEVATPYLVRHSVTIWCASLDGQLYVGARDPDSKRWPGWVDRDSNVRLEIDGEIYPGHLTRVDDPAQVTRIQHAYAAKYDLAEPRPAGSPPIRYWRVEPPS